MNPLLTVAIPTYNRPQTLKRALDALAEQYDERVEILVCDDGSGDDAQNVVLEEQKKIPIRYIKNEVNLGYDKNFLQCFAKARGKYILLMGDDDILIDLGHIIQYLEKADNITWIYINSVGFDGEWTDREKTSLRSSLPIIEDKFNISKHEFMDYAKFALTADVSIVLRDKISDIQVFEKYIGTYFMQTCIPLHLTKEEDYVLGIIGRPCIAGNASHEDRHVYKKWRTYFQLFAVGLKNVLCNIAPECGYDKRQMEKIFKKGILNMVYPIAYMNAAGLDGWRKAFWSDAFPAIREYVIAWLVPIPIAIAPRWFARFLLNGVYPVVHKLLLILRQV